MAAKIFRGCGMKKCKKNAEETMDGRFPLVCLRCGESARIDSVNAEGETALRLTELGYFPGERVEKVLKSPLGDPCAYRVRGTVAALRNADAARIRIRPEEEK